MLLVLSGDDALGPALARALTASDGRGWRLVSRNPSGDEADVRPSAVIVGGDLDAETVEPVLRRVAGGAEPPPVFGIGRPPAGAPLPVDDWLDDADATPAVLARLVRQAVELRRLRAEIAASEARFRSTIQRTADGVIILDADGLILFANDAAGRLFGRPAAELVGEDFGAPVVVGETAEIDLYRPAERGGPVVAELRSVETTWEAGPARLVALRDITDRRQAEERARRLVVEQAAREKAERAERRSRFLAEVSSVLEASLEYETTLANVAGLMVPALADWCVIDVIEDGRPVRVAVRHQDEDAAPLLDRLRHEFPPQPDSRHPASRVLRSGEAVRLEDVSGRLDELAESADHARLLAELGTRSVLAVPLAARNETVGVITLVCGEDLFDEDDFALAREIGVRAGAAVQNARLYEAAVAANQAKSDFLAVVSHELRTPLNAIMGYTEILLSGIAGELNGEASSHLGRINSSAKHLLQIIEEILTYARMEAGREALRPERVRLGPLLSEVEAVAAPLAREKQLEFVCRVEEPDAEITTDPGKVRQILLNLLSNAAKFTDEGSVVVTARIDGDEAVFAVEDTGIGIAAEHLEAIFDSFWQIERASTRRSGGTGLGLSVSRRLAEMLNGSLEVASEVGAGSRFTLRVPRHMELDGAAGSD